MPSSYTPNLRLIEQATGENSGTWGTNLNNGMIALTDSAIAGIVTINSTGGTHSLTSNNGSADEARNAILNITGTLASNLTIVAPSGVSKIYLVANNTSGAHNVILSSGGTTVTITQGNVEYCYTDGTNFHVVGGNGGLQGTATGAIDMNNYQLVNAKMRSYYEYYTALGSVNGAVNLDFAAGNTQSLTLTGNTTLTLVNFPASGTTASMTLQVTQDGTGSHTLTFAGATIKVPGGGGLVLTGTANSLDVVVFESNDGGSTLYLSVLKNYS